MKTTPTRLADAFISWLEVMDEGRKGKNRLLSDLISELREERLVDTKLSHKGGSLKRKARVVDPRFVDKNNRIHQLEERLRSQRDQITRLEDCRKFERQTEKKLAQALSDVYETADRSEDVTGIVGEIQEIAADALVEYVTRLGPRSR